MVSLKLNLRLFELRMGYECDMNYGIQSERTAQHADNLNNQTET